MEANLSRQNPISESKENFPNVIPLVLGAAVAVSGEICSPPPSTELSSEEEQSSYDASDDNQCEQEVRPKERTVSRKRHAEDNEYFEFDWDDDLRAEGHLPPLSQPCSRDEELEPRPHFVRGGETPANYRFIQRMSYEDDVITDRSELRYDSNCDDIVRVRESADVFATQLHQKLVEVSKNRTPEHEIDPDRCRSTGAGPPAHQENSLWQGSYIAIESNGRVIPCIYIGSTEFVMEVDILDARKIGWTSSKKKSIVDRKQFISVLKNVESLPQPKSKSLIPLKVLIIQDPILP